MEGLWFLEPRISSSPSLSPHNQSLVLTFGEVFLSGPDVSPEPSNRSRAGLTRTVFSHGLGGAFPFGGVI